MTLTEIAFAVLGIPHFPFAVNVFTTNEESGAPPCSEESLVSTNRQGVRGKYEYGPAARARPALESRETRDEAQ